MMRLFFITRRRHNRELEAAREEERRHCRERLHELRVAHKEELRAVRRCLDQYLIDRVGASVERDVARNDVCALKLEWSNVIASRDEHAFKQVASWIADKARREVVMYYYKRLT